MALLRKVKDEARLLDIELKRWVGQAECYCPKLTMHVRAGIGVDYIHGPAFWYLAWWGLKRVAAPEK